MHLDLSIPPEYVFYVIESCSCIPSMYRLIPLKCDFDIAYRGVLQWFVSIQDLQRTSIETQVEVVQNDTNIFVISLLIRAE